MNVRIAVITAALFGFAGALPGAEVPSAEHVQWMKDLGKQMGAMRKGVEVEKNANDMAAVLKEVGAFWRKRNSDVAMKSNRMTRQGALALAKAAAAGDDTAKGEAMKQIGAGCKGCHEAHREKISDTEYHIK